MKRFLDRLIETPIGRVPRVLVVVAALCLTPSYVAPLWNMTLFAPQYPDGLRLDIYSYKFESGNQGQDIKEINLLNHYIGMRDLAAEDFTEFKWMPFVIGVLALLFLRAAVFGRMSQLIDVIALFVYFSAFALWHLGYKLYRYGHDLAPTAAVKIPAFTPPILGHSKLANFDVYSYPGLGAYAFIGSAVALAGALVLALIAYRRKTPA